MRANRRRLRRFMSIVALLAITSIYFMPFSFVGIGHASSVTPPHVSPPQVTPPHVTPPEVVPREVVPPEVTPPEITPREVTPPDVTPPDGASYDYGFPGVGGPGVGGPGGSGPGIGGPGVGSPGIGGPGIGNPRIGGPGVGGPGSDSPIGGGPGGYIPGGGDWGDGSGSVHEENMIGLGREIPENGSTNNFLIDASKFTLSNIVLNSVNDLSRNWVGDWKNFDWQGAGIRDLKSLGKGAFKTVLGNIAPDNAFGDYLKFGLDAWTGYDNYKTVRNFFKSGESIKLAYQFTKGANATNWTKAGSFFSNIANNPVKSFPGIASKVAPWTAGISGAISAVELGVNVSKGEYNKAIGNLGEVLMSGAVVAGASGVGAPVAAGLAVAGGALWLGSKIYAHRKTIGKGVKKIAKGAANIGKKAWSAVKGFFS